MKRFSLAIFTSFAVTGCVGAGPVITRTSTTELVTSVDRKLCPSKEIRGPQYWYCDKGKEPSITMGQFRSIWGEPKSHGVKDGQEYLIYNIDLAWRGFVVFAIIPIPLLLPVGHNELTLFFDHDRIVRVTEEYGYGSFAICGVHSEGPDPIGCLIWH